MPLSILQTRQISKIGRKELRVPPSCEPLAGLDYAQYLRVPPSQASAATIQQKLRSARIKCENHTWRAFVKQTWDWIMDLPPGFGFDWRFTRFSYYVPAEITLPRPPLIKVLGIFITDDAGTETTIDPDIYWVSRTRNPGRVMIREQETWPDPAGKTFDTFRIRFTAGYAQPFVIDPNTSIITAADHAYAEGDVVTLSNQRGALPGGLAPSLPYFAVNVSNDTLQLAAASGGSPISVGNAGAGFHFLGEVPEPILRAILATAGADFFGVKLNDKEKISGGLPEAARDDLALYRIRTIGQNP